MGYRSFCKPTSGQSSCIFLELYGQSAAKKKKKRLEFSLGIVATCTYVVCRDTFACFPEFEKLARSTECLPRLFVRVAVSMGTSLPRYNNRTTMRHHHHLIYFSIKKKRISIVPLRAWITASKTRKDVSLVRGFNQQS